MLYKERRHPRVVNKELIQRQKATDFLYEQMVFWGGKGKKLIELTHKCLLNGHIVEAARFMKEFNDVNNRAIDIAAKLAPYQSAKHASIEINSKITKQYVIVAPRISRDAQDWLTTIKQDQKSLPKPIEIPQKPTYEEIEEAQYE